MFLKLFGFICLVAGLGYLTVAAFFIGLMGLGTYNIGGAPNSFKGKVFIIIGYAFIVYLWVKLVEFAPFSFNLIP